MSQLNAEVRHVFSVVDLIGAPVNGLTSANFTITLRRRSGVALISTPEVVGVQAMGGGEYWVFYTPTQSPTLYLLGLVPQSSGHIANPSQWQDEIGAVVVPTAGPYLTTRANMKAAFGFASDERDSAIDALLPQNAMFEKLVTAFFCVRYGYPERSRAAPCVRPRPAITAVESLHIRPEVPACF
jgi:hypothetical protein